MLIKKLKESIENGTAESTIPEELLKVFNDELPEGMKYQCLDSSHLVVDLSQTKNTFTFNDSENKAFFDKYGKYIKSGDDILKIARLAQTTLKVNNEKTVYKGTEIDRKFVFRSVFDNEDINPIGYLEPPELPTICLELSDNEDRSINTIVHLQMQQCDNIEQCVYSNVAENETICVTMVADSEYSHKKICNFSFNMYIANKNAKYVTDVINAYKLYVALIENRLLINGYLFDYKNDIDDEKRENIFKGLKLYEKMYQIERKLGVHFDLSVETDEEDLYYLNGLYSSFIENKPFVNYQTIDNVVITKSEHEDMINRVGKDHLFAFCLSGKLELTIYGQDIKVYYIRIASKLRIKGTEQVEDENVKLLFESEENKPTIVCMLYQSEQELDNAMSEDNFIEKILALAHN